MPAAYYTYPLFSDVNRGIYYESGWKYLTVTTNIGVYPQSPPNVAIARRPFVANITTYPVNSILQSAYVACTCASDQPWFPFPISIPVGCKITIQAFGADNRAIQGAKNEFTFYQDALQLSAYNDLSVTSFPELMRLAPPSRMVPIRINLPPAMRYQFSAAVATRPFIVPPGLPANLSSTLQDALQRVDSSSFAFVLDDLRYTRLEP